MYQEHCGLKLQIMTERYVFASLTTYFLTIWTIFSVYFAYSLSRRGGYINSYPGTLAFLQGY